MARYEVFGTNAYRIREMAQNIGARIIHLGSRWANHWGCDPYGFGDYACYEYKALLETDQMIPWFGGAVVVFRINDRGKVEKVFFPDDLPGKP